MLMMRQTSRGQHPGTRLTEPLEWNGEVIGQPGDLDPRSWVWMSLEEGDTGEVEVDLPEVPGVEEATAEVAAVKAADTPPDLGVSAVFAYRRVYVTQDAEQCFTILARDVTIWP